MSEANFDTEQPIFIHLLITPYFIHLLRNDKWANISIKLYSTMLKGGKVKLYVKVGTIALLLFLGEVM